MLFKTLAAAALVASAAAMPGHGKGNKSAPPAYTTSSVPASTAPPAYTTSSSVAPPAYSTPAESSGAPPAYSTPVSSETAPPAYSSPSGPWKSSPTAPVSPPASSPWYPYGTPSSSVCVETSTQIWRSTTAVTTYAVTAASGWQSATGAYSTGTWASGATAPPAAPTFPVVATGAASSFSVNSFAAAGVALFAGAAALLL